MIKLNDFYSIYEYHSIYLILINNDIPKNDRGDMVNFFMKKNRTLDLIYQLREDFYNEFDCNKYELILSNGHTLRIIER
jgi:hypothetical protein